MTDAPDVLDDDAPNRGLPRRRDDWRERRLAHTPDERRAVAARLRAAQRRFGDLYPAYHAAIEERDAAALAARDVGMARRTIARILGVPWSNVTRMQERAIRRAEAGRQATPDET